MEERGPPWSKHFDEEYQTYYWHNSVTSQSIWIEDEDTEAASSENDGIRQQSPQQSPQQDSSSTKKQQQDSIQTAPANTDIRFSRIENYDENNLPDVKEHRKQRKLPKTTHDDRGVELSAMNRPREPDDLSSSPESSVYDDSTALWTQRDEDRARGVRRPSQLDINNEKRISRDILIYSICIFINAFLLEGPLAVTEGVFRAGVFLAGSVLIFLSAAVRMKGSLFLMSYQLFRDAILSLGAAVTLCIPGASCLVYRRYRLDDAWELAPIPTIFGWVDSRRFMSFTFGNGCFAANVRHDNYLYDLHERDVAGIEYTSSSDQDHLDRPCDDSWGGVIFMEPRRVHADIIRIVRGEDPLQILRSTGLKNKKYSPVGVDEEMGVQL